MENGKIIKHVVMENIYKVMVIDMLDISLIGRNMGKERNFSVMVTDIKEIIRMENHMDMASIFGVMEHHFKVIFKMDYDLVKVFGEGDQILQLTNFKENMRKIKRMVMVYIVGLMGMNIEVCLLMIINMDMEKCIIQMVVV